LLLLGVPEGKMREAAAALLLVGVEPDAVEDAPGRRAAVGAVAELGRTGRRGIFAWQISENLESCGFCFDKVTRAREQH
jgi:hypothetical protein